MGSGKEEGGTHTLSFFIHIAFMDSFKRKEKNEMPIHMFFYSNETENGIIMQANLWFFFFF